MKFPKYFYHDYLVYFGSSRTLMEQSRTRVFDPTAVSQTESVSLGRQDIGVHDLSSQFLLPFSYCARCIWF